MYLHRLWCRDYRATTHNSWRSWSSCHGISNARSYWWDAICPSPISNSSSCSSAVGSACDNNNRGSDTTNIRNGYRRGYPQALAHLLRETTLIRPCTIERNRLHRPSISWASQVEVRMYRQSRSCGSSPIPWGEFLVAFLYRLRGRLHDQFSRFD